MKCLPTFCLSTEVSISVEWLKESWVKKSDHIVPHQGRNSTLLRFWEFLKLKAICYTTIISIRERVMKVRQSRIRTMLINSENCEMVARFAWKRVKCFLGGFPSSIIIGPRVRGLISASIPSSVRWLSWGFCWCGKTPWPKPTCVGRSLFQLIVEVHHEWQSGQGT